MTNYASGRRLEWKMKGYFQSLGFFVVRSAGSRSPVDLIAIGSNRLLLIQCKSGDSSFTKAEQDDFVNFVHKLGAEAVLVRHDLYKKTKILIYSKPGIRATVTILSPSSKEDPL